jgi:hypothetical protein
MNIKHPKSLIINFLFEKATNFIERGALSIFLKNDEL